MGSTTPFQETRVHHKRRNIKREKELAIKRHPSPQKREENQRHLVWANQNPHLAVESMMLSLEKNNLYPSGYESVDAVAAVKAENCRCVVHAIRKPKMPITSSPCLKYPINHHQP